MSLGLICTVTIVAGGTLLGAPVEGGVVDPGVGGGSTGAGVTGGSEGAGVESTGAGVLNGEKKAISV